MVPVVRRGLPPAVLVGLVFLVGCESGPKTVEIEKWYVTSDPIPTYQGVYRVPTDGPPKVWVIFYAQFPVDQLWVEQSKGVKFHWAPESFVLVTADGQETAGKYGDADGRFGLGGPFMDEPGEKASKIGIAFLVDESAAQAGPMKVKYLDRAEFDLPADKKVDAPQDQPTGPGGAAPKGMSGGGFPKGNAEAGEKKE